MLTQAVGSSVLGLFIEGGYTYDAVFATAALFLGATIAVLVVLERTGQLPE